MLTIYDSHHIPTNRNIKCHPACRTHTGVFMDAGESRRIRQESSALINRRFRYAWLIQQWAMHEERCRFVKEEYR